MLFDLFFGINWGHFWNWCLVKLLRAGNSNLRNDLRLRDVLWANDIEEFIHEILVLFDVDVEAEVDRWKNLKLAFDQGLLVNPEGACIVDVILEAILIFIDKEGFLIVFVCEKEAGAIESKEKVFLK